MVIAALSTVVEWYDFTLYLYIATILSRVFFGGGETALIAALAAFAGTFLVPGVRSQPAWNAERIQALEAQLRASPHVRALLMERRGASFAYYQQGTTASTRTSKPGSPAHR